MIYKLFKNTLLTLFALVVLVPSSIVVLGSFKKDVEIYTKPLALPEVWNLDNFRTLIESGSVLTPFKNSVIVAVFSVFFTILFASLVAYTIARSVTISGKVLFALFSLGLAIPGIQAQFTGVSTISQNQTIRFEGDSANAKAVILGANLKPGTHTDLSLFFGNAGEVKFDVLVQKPAGIYEGITA